MVSQVEAIEFVRELAKGKTTYRVAKILGVSWPTVRNWLSENPKEIELFNLEKIEKAKNNGVM